MFYNDFMKPGIKCLLLAAVLWMLSACTNQKNVSLPLSLATFTENDVEVSIRLEGSSVDGYFLAATFTPADGFHMYSKDIPPGGVDGLGRPTWIELGGESQMTPLGGLIESVHAEVPDFEPRELLVYPPGAVTLSMPIDLPPGNDWVEESVKVSYMSCSDKGCKAPVVGKLVPIRVPGAGMSITGDENE